MTQEWKLTDEEIANIKARGLSIEEAQRKKKQAYLEANKINVVTHEYTKGEWGAFKSASGDWVIATDDELICREVRHYNAHLIAQAPRLYEALEKIRAITPETIIYDIANTAIAAVEEK